MQHGSSFIPVEKVDFGPTVGLFFRDRKTVSQNNTFVLFSEYSSLMWRKNNFFKLWISFDKNASYFFFKNINWFKSFRFNRAQETKDESTFHFNGQGYAEFPQIPRYDSRQYSVTFSFKSLDENALLFLAINETLVSYLNALSAMKKTCCIQFPFFIFRDNTSVWN